MNRRAGFTLVEMLLTLGVLAVGLTVLFTLLPGVAETSRELRDRGRMLAFAENVFTALEWELTPAVLEAEEETAAERRRLLTPIGVQEVVRTGDWIRWPSDPGADALVPVWQYTLSLETTEVDRVEARLSVRTDSLPDPVVYTRMFTLSPPAW